MSSRTRIPAIRKNYPQPKEEKREIYEGLPWIVTTYSVSLRCWMLHSLAFITQNNCCQFSFLGYESYLLALYVCSLRCCSLDLVIEALGSCHKGRKELETKESSERLKRWKSVLVVKCLEWKKKEFIGSLKGWGWKVKTEACFLRCVE